MNVGDPNVHSRGTRGAAHRAGFTGCPCSPAALPAGRAAVHPLQPSQRVPFPLTRPVRVPAPLGYPHRRGGHVGAPPRQEVVERCGGGQAGQEGWVGEQAGIGGSSKQVWQRSSTKPFTVLRPWGHRPHSPPPLQPTVEVGPPVLRLHIAPHAVAPPVEAVDVQVEGVEVWGQGLRHAGAYVVASVGAVVPWLAGLFRQGGREGGNGPVRAGQGGSGRLAGRQAGWWGWQVAGGQRWAAVAAALALPDKETAQSSTRVAKQRAESSRTGRQYQKQPLRPPVLLLAARRAGA